MWPLIRLLPKSFHFHYVKWSPYTGIVSGLLILASIGLMTFQGLNLGIDFKGGVSLEIAMPRAIPLAEVRRSLEVMGAHDGQVQGYGEANSAMVTDMPAA